MDTVPIRTISAGAVAGVCSAMAVKQVGKALGVAVGSVAQAGDEAKRLSAMGDRIGFLGLQTLSHLGYVKIDWAKAEADAIAHVRDWRVAASASA